jgi:phosphoesterase RecJ-like protein
MDKRFDKVLEEIKKGKRFLVVSHVNPEGDAIGSTIGLALALKKLGKDVTPYLEDQIPSIYRFLPGADLVSNKAECNNGYDATFVVDCCQMERLGKEFKNILNRGKIINIDHHTTNDHFGDINIIDPKACAAGELIYDLLKAASIEITKDIAVNLFVAIHTDTGSFKYSATTPGAFRKAGELVALGADPWEISQHVYESYPLKRMKLLTRVLDTLELTDGGKIASLVVTRNLLNKFQAKEDLVEGFVNYARAIEGVEVALLFRETSAGEYKVSFRSKGNIDVANVAHSFGGGGHVNASGCNISGNLESAKEQVIGAIEGTIRNKRLAN